MDTIIQQGTFTSATDIDKVVALRADSDWMEVINYTNIGATANDGCVFRWHRGMPQGRGIYQFKSGGANTLNMGLLAAGAGFYRLDTSVRTATVQANLVTDIASAVHPIITSNGHTFDTGDIFRLVNCTGALQLTGIDFSCLYVGANTFSSRYAFNVAPVAAAVPGANAMVYKISNDTMYAPRNRTIIGVTQANPAVVTLSVTHNYTVGQKVRFSVPEVVSGISYGMIELDKQIATITAVSAANNTITVDIDASAYTVFAFPLTADVPFTPAQVIPVGENTSAALIAGTDLLADATNNTSYIGMKLMYGATSPGGEAGDLMYWTAGRSFSNLIE